MVELNRRTFLSGSVAAGAAALFGTEAAHAAGAVKLPAKWDETADVVIVGSGFAGLAAAIEAKKAGASVVVLEKMATVGGNSIINGGILTATGCPQQKKHGIKDSPELLAHDMLVAGLYLNNPEKVKLVADNALSNYEWTVNELGVEYNRMPSVRKAATVFRATSSRRTVRVRALSRKKLRNWKNSASKSVRVLM